ncbi:MAG TPA: hypothetical protein VKU60_15695 [Chloroflexota bacterium]|nr:hypothetical protein [Chloroflexota bacterium]
MAESLVQIAVRARDAERCLCGAVKKSGRPFCVGCYVALPQSMRKALYKTIRQGFATEYDAAKTFLQCETDRLKQGSLL